MATAPRIDYFDGSGTTNELVLTTNLFNLVFTGSVDANTIDVQIDVNGAGFVSDPSLVGLTVPKFTLPNLASYPNGLPLDKGRNIIRLRAIDLSGAVSPVSTIIVDVMSNSDIGLIPAPPTGVQIKRKTTNVELAWSDLTTQSATGYHVYASTEPGGGGSGYLRVNAEMIPAARPTTTSVETFAAATASFDFSEDESLDLQIIARTVDPVSGAVVEQKTLNQYPLIQNPNVRFSFTVDAMSTVKNHTFSHDRGASVGSGILNNDVFAAVQSDDPLYYVVSAIYFDKTTGVLQESRFSVELAGAPLSLDAAVRGIRIRDQRAISQGYIQEVQRKEPTLALIPGSTVREVHIEPFSNEMQKAYFLADWVHRSKSFAAMLAIDDPTFSGVSVPVSQSSYKQNLKTALSIADDSAVQSFIDSSFDSLASSFGIARQGSRSAVVNQTFYTTTKPVKDLIVAQGAIVSSSTNSTAPRFVAQGAVILSAANALAYYNPDLRRYEVQVQMVADIPGGAGNVPAGALDTVTSGANGLQTVNEFAADFGRDAASNLEVAEEGARALSSLDTGTEGGYERISFGTPGVLDAFIVKSGDPQMMRDYDDVRKKHIGGKVDIYIKGTNERTVTETFAFQFSVAKSVRFDVIDAEQLTFRARDSRLTPSNPIQEMLNNPSQGFGLRNHSNLPTTEYDLTGVTILDYRTIKLNTLIPQPSTLLDDFVEGDYRYRSNNKFTAGVQPIRRVTSVIGSSSGALDPASGFTLYKLQDPLLDGESTMATDYVTINQVDGVPNGEAIPINDEQHVLIGEFPEPLGSVGVNAFTLAVYSLDRSILYNGPDTANPDYLVVAGSQTKPLKIVRSSTSSIPTGATVSVDYEHDENFVVTYVVNDTLQQVQARVKKAKHLTADALVKQAVENPLSAEVTVQLAANAVQPTVDSALRTAVSVLLDRKGIGNVVHQSDMTGSMERVDGVDYLVQPFTKLTLQDGAVRVRDPILSDYVFISSLSQFTNAVYILTDDLPFATTDGGGPSTVHHGVYKDELIMESSPTLADVGAAVNRAFVIGKNGAIIQGYSDDATLLPEFITAEAVAAERLRRTANRVLVSLNAGLSPADVPTDHSFAVTYVVSGDRGSKDIGASQVEYLTPGDLTVTYKKAV
jgi:hypothetical protein